jgi:hypothetical protein
MLAAAVVLVTLEALQTVRVGMAAVVLAHLQQTELQELQILAAVEVEEVITVLLG